MNPGYQGTYYRDAAASGPAASGAVEPPGTGDEEFLHALEQCTLPPAHFDHASHVRAGYLYLRRLPFPQATAAMCATIANYACALGQPDRYHETITIGFMCLIHAQLWQRKAGVDWDSFRADNPQLFSKDALLGYFPRQVLDSPEARARFVLVPLAPGPGPGPRPGNQASDAAQLRPGRRRSGAARVGSRRSAGR